MFFTISLVTHFLVRRFMLLISTYSVYFICVTHLSLVYKYFRYNIFRDDCNLNRLSHRRLHFHFQLLNIYRIIIILSFMRCVRETENSQFEIRFTYWFVSFFVCGACEQYSHLFIPNHQHFAIMFVCCLLPYCQWECHTLYAPNKIFDIDNGNYNKVDLISVFVFVIAFSHFSFCSG